MRYDIPCLKIKSGKKIVFATFFRGPETLSPAQQFDIYFLDIFSETFRLLLYSLITIESLSFLYRARKIRGQSIQVSVVVVDGNGRTYEDHFFSEERRTT